MNRFFDDRDLGAGLVFVVAGVAALALGADLNVGTAADMGEGYVPRAMAVALVVLGTLVVLLAWWQGPGRSDARVESMRWRPLLFITAAILAFVATLESLGLIAAIACSATAANFAGRPLPARALAILIAVLGLVVVTVFVWGLGLPLRVVPRFS